MMNFLFSILLLAGTEQFSNLSSDEQIQFFPSRTVETGEITVKVTVHGRVFEPEVDDTLRRMMIKKFPVNFSFPRVPWNILFFVSGFMGF